MRAIYTTIEITFILLLTVTTGPVQTIDTTLVPYNAEKWEGTPIQIFVFNRYSYTISRFGLQSLSTTPVGGPLSFYTKNTTRIGDITVDVYVVWKSNLSYRPSQVIIVAYKDGSSISYSYIYELTFLQFLKADSTWIIIGLPLPGSTLNDLADVLIAIAKVLVSNNILEENLGLTRYFSKPLDEIPVKEKIGLFLKFFFLDSVIVNPKPSTNDFIRQFLLEGVSPRTFSHIAAYTLKRLGIDSFLIYYDLGSPSYSSYVAVANLNTSISPIDALFTARRGSRKYYIVAGLPQDLYSWSLLYAGKYSKLEFYRPLPTGDLLEIHGYKVNIEHGWFLASGKGAIFECTSMDNEYYAPACNAINVIKAVKYGEGLGLRLAGKISAGISSIETGRNYILYYLYPWIFHRTVPGSITSGFNPGKINITGTEPLTQTPSKGPQRPPFIIPASRLPTVIVIVVATSSLLYAFYLLFLKKYRIKMKPQFPVYQPLHEEDKIVIDKNLLQNKTIDLGSASIILALFNELLLKLSKNVEKSPWETPREYGYKIKNALGESAYRAYMMLCRIYEKARYTRARVTSDDLRVFTRLYLMLLSEAEEK